MTSSQIFAIITGTKCDLKIDSTDLSNSELIRIVDLVGIHKRHITIRNLGNKSVIDLIKIVGTYSDNVTFDLT